MFTGAKGSSTAFQRIFEKQIYVFYEKTLRKFYFSLTLLSGNISEKYLKITRCVPSTSLLLIFLYIGI